MGVGRRGGGGGRGRKSELRAETTNRFFLRSEYRADTSTPVSMYGLHSRTHSVGLPLFSPFIYNELPFIHTMLMRQSSIVKSDVFSTGMRVRQGSINGSDGA